MHAPATHVEALHRFDFDTVLTPYNYRLSLEKEYRHQFEALVDAVRTADAGLMLIKAVARNLWRTGQAPTRATWYEPLEDQGAIDAAIAFALATDGVTGIATPGDVGLLSAVLEAERRHWSISREHATATGGRPGHGAAVRPPPGQSDPRLAGTPRLIVATLVS